MSGPCLFDYAVIRLVPKVELEEFINVGVILSCPKFKFLECRIGLNEDRMRCLAPDVDVEMVHNSLDAIPRVCEGGPAAGAIGELAQRARFYWLTAQRSTIIQASSIHTGLTGDPQGTIDDLFLKYVR